MHSKIDELGIDSNLFKDNLTTVGHERKYLNKEDYLRIICDYCVAYCCKGEKSPADAVKLFGTLVQNAADHTTFSSLCQRLNMLVLKQRSIVRG